MLYMSSLSRLKSQNDVQKAEVTGQPVAESFDSLVSITTVTPKKERAL